ncbi:hypothetical protein LguiB_035722 [Lonicera macranthoides]
MTMASPSTAINFALADPVNLVPEVAISATGVNFTKDRGEYIQLLSCHSSSKGSNFSLNIPSLVIRGVHGSNFCLVLLNVGLLLHIRMIEHVNIYS